MGLPLAVRLRQLSYLPQPRVRDFQVDCSLPCIALAVIINLISLSTDLPLKGQIFHREAENRPFAGPGMQKNPQF